MGIVPFVHIAALPVAFRSRGCYRATALPLERVTMEFRLTYRRFLPGLLLSGFMLAAAGCQSGDSKSTTLDTASADTAQPAEDKVKESDLQGFCPRVSLRDGTAYFTSYAKGGQDDPSKLIYQAAITDVTRGCRRENGMINITVAVAGKIVPGPVGKPGTVTMPIRIVALQDNKVAYSQLHKHQVQMTDTSAATQFVFNDPNLSLPDTGKKDIQIYAGYDEGPPKKKKSADEE
jgi:hypothetical protein